LRHDSARFRTLLKRIHGKIGCMCADKANSCRENTQLVKDMGGRPFLMPRKNASTKVKGNQAWREMVEFKELHPEEFKRRYHKRSSSESTNSSFKGKYGELLSSRKWRGQKSKAGPEGHSVQRKIVGQEQNKTGGRDMGLSQTPTKVNSGFGCMHTF
jgi:hypothetical protein